MTTVGNSLLERFVSALHRVLDLQRQLRAEPVQRDRLVLGDHALIETRCERLDVGSRVVVRSSRRESWTVIGEDGVPIDPIERYLAYLSDVDRSPNTVKAYAHEAPESRLLAVSARG